MTRLEELLGRVVGSSGSIASKLSASEWHELAEEAATAYAELEKWTPDETMTPGEVVGLARVTVHKYGADADKPSVHLAKRVINGAHERDSLRSRVRELETWLTAAIDGHEDGTPPGYDIESARLAAVKSDAPRFNR